MIHSDQQLHNNFLLLWERHFNGEDIPGKCSNFHQQICHTLKAQTYLSSGSVEDVWTCSHNIKTLQYISEPAIQIACSLTNLTNSY